MRRMEARRILPLRVFGKRLTTRASLKAATGPMRSRTRATSSRVITASSVFTPALSTTRPSGTWPLSSSAAPTTAHSATAGWAASTSSIAPVERRWPATLMMSSVRPITHTSPSASITPASPVRYQPG
jgi:hypothetical protein